MRSVLALLAATVGLAALAPACAEVRIDDRSEVDSSAVGAGGGGASGSDAAVQGSGGAGASPATSGAGGAHPTVPEVVECRALAWREPSTAGAMMDGVRTASAQLAFAPQQLDGDDHLLVLGSSYDDETPPAMAEAYLRVGGTMDTAPRPYRASILDVAPPVTFRGGVPIVVHVDEDLGPRLVDLAGAGEESLSAQVPADLASAIALAWSPAAARFAVVHGSASAPALTLVDEAGVSTGVGTLACSDRAAPVAIAPLGDRFLVARESRVGLAPCEGAPPAPSTTLQLDVVTAEGGIASSAAIALDGAIADLQLAPRTDGAAWAAVRTSDADHVRVVRIGLDGAPGPSTTVPVGGGRAFAIAARGEGVAVLDVGAAIGGEPLARLRVLDGALAVVAAADMPLVHALVPEGRPALHVSPDGAVLAGGWIGRRGDGGTRLVAAPARCE